MACIGKRLVISVRYEMTQAVYDYFNCLMLCSVNISHGSEGTGKNETGKINKWWEGGRTDDCCGRSSGDIIRPLTRQRLRSAAGYNGCVFCVLEN